MSSKKFAEDAAMNSLSREIEAYSLRTYRPEKSQERICQPSIMMFNQKERKAQ